MASSNLSQANGGPHPSSSSKSHSRSRSRSHSVKQADVYNASVLYPSPYPSFLSHPDGVAAAASATTGTTSTSTNTTQQTAPTTSNPPAVQSSPPSLSRTLVELARRMASSGPVKTQFTPKRVRILFNGAIIADTVGTASGALYVWEHEHYPQFYLPMEAFIKPTGFTVHLEPGDSITDSTDRVIVGGGLKLRVKRNDAPDTDYKHLTEMVLFAADLAGPGKPLRNMVKVRFDAVGQWFEEDTPIYVHPKDPYVRVDLLQNTSRPIRVLIDGVVVAHSTYAVHLYETGLPARFYVPLTALDTSVLRPSTTRSQCPYKGEAQYHSVVVKEKLYPDLVWYYTRPTVECAPVMGLCCFYNEKVDVEFELGGKWKREERPVTHMI